MAQNVNVFFYGLFMAPEALQAKGLRPDDVRRAYVEGLELRLGQRATLVPADKGCQVYGTIMRLTHEEIDRLYSEPSVSAYRPEPVLARLPDGSSEPALCFNLPSAPAETAGNPEYAAALRAVAQKMGLPQEYVAGLSG
jgi:Gamma-glutamyl cyclotransferase, AIG2-like